MSKARFRQYTLTEQKALARWAEKCAKRVLPLFEKGRGEDARPREALAALRAWIRTGKFKMSTIRAASLGSHAAAREMADDPVATFAARAAGQAVGTAHVPQHAYGAALYALKAIAAGDPEKAVARIARERAWQSAQLPPKLRTHIMSRIVVRRTRATVHITLNKDPGF
jgi:hypothetical protein